MSTSTAADYQGIGSCPSCGVTYPGPHGPECRHSGPRFVPADDKDATIARLTADLAAARAEVEDAERWRAFIAIALDGNVELPNVDINYTPSGYNGGQWSTVELCWKHPQWTGWTKDHADAAIDAARKAPATPTGSGS